MSMSGPGCAVMCNLINTHTHTHNFRCKTREGQICSERLLSRFFVRNKTDRSEKHTLTVCCKLLWKHYLYEQLGKTSVLTLYQIGILRINENYCIRVAHFTSEEPSYRSCSAINRLQLDRFRVGSVEHFLTTRGIWWTNTLVSHST